MPWFIKNSWCIYFQWNSKIGAQRKANQEHPAGCFQVSAPTEFFFYLQLFQGIHGACWPLFKKWCGTFTWWRSSSLPGLLACWSQWNMLVFTWLLEISWERFQWLPCIFWKNIRCSVSSNKCNCMHCTIYAFQRWHLQSNSPNWQKVNCNGQDMFAPTLEKCYSCMPFRFGMSKNQSKISICQIHIWLCLSICILLNPVMVMMSSNIPLMPISQAIFGYMHTWCFHGMQCLFLKPFLAINMLLPWHVRFLWSTHCLVHLFCFYGSGFYSSSHFGYIYM